MKTEVVTRRGQRDLRG